MFHHVAHAVAGRCLFTDWEAAAALWRFVLRHAGPVDGLVLMPDHVHMIARTGRHPGLVTACRAFARWTSWHRRPGPLWDPIPAPDAVPNAQHRRRTLRYLYLNPCRARLVACPVAWPFSTYRDVLGLAATPVVRRHPDPASLHDYVSADPSAAVQGTPFPGSLLRSDRIPVDVVACAMSEWTRTPLPALLATRPGRRRVLAACLALTAHPPGQLARALGVHRSTVHRARPLSPADADVIARLAADHRTLGLVGADPRLRPTVRRR